MQRPQTLVALAALTLVVLGITIGGAEASLIVFPAAALTDGIDGFTELDGAHGIAITQISDRTYAVVVALEDDGVQIIDMTNPASPTPVAEITDGVDGFTTLDGARDVAIAQIFGRIYAVVAAEDDDGVQIIDMTNPASPTPVAEITDGVDGFTTLDGARDVAIAQIFGRIYAVVAAEDDDGVQIIDMTNPASPTPVAEITDGVDGFTELDGAHEIAITKILGRPYAVVTAWHDNGVQIIDMTNPAAPTPTAALTDGLNGFTELGGAHGIAITQISDRTYAVVVARDDNGVQIIDMTNPASPTPVAEITDGLNGFTTLDGPHDVAITQISGRTYAVVTSFVDDGVQIIDMTNPALPVPAAALTDGIDGFTTLDGPHDVAITQISDRTYAVVVARDDNGVQIIDITGTTIAANRPVDVLVYGYNDGVRPITAGHIALLESRGYVVETSSGPVAAEQMEKASVVVGWSLNVQDVEARDALEEYVYGGGRLLLLLDTQYATCGTEKVPCWYDFTKDAFGFKYDGDVQGGIILPAEGSERHPVWNSPNMLSEFSDWCCDAYVGEITDAQNVKVIATVSGQSYKLGTFTRVQDVPAIVVNDNPAWGGGMVVGTGIDMVMGWHGPDMRMFDNLIEFMVSGGEYARLPPPPTSTDLVHSGGFYTNLDATISVIDYQRTEYGHNSLIQITAQITNHEAIVLTEPNHQNNYQDGEILVFLGGTMPPPSKGTEYRNSFGYGDKSSQWLRGSGADVSTQDCTSEGYWTDIRPAETGVEKLCFWVPSSFTPDGLFVATYDVINKSTTTDLNDVIIRAQIIPFTTDSAYCGDHPDICKTSGLQNIDSDTYEDPHPPYVPYVDTASLARALGQHGPQ